MENKAAATGGSSLGVGTICFIIFLCGKLANIAPFASWSWLKVIFLPIVISVAFSLAIVLAFIIIILIVAIIKHLTRNR